MTAFVASVEVAKGLQGVRLRIDVCSVPRGVHIEHGNIFDSSLQIDLECALMCNLVPEDDILKYWVFLYQLVLCCFPWSSGLLHLLVKASC